MYLLRTATRHVPLNKGMSLTTDKGLHDIFELTGGRMIERQESCQKVSGRAEYCILFAYDQLPGDGLMELRITLPDSMRLKSRLDAAGVADGPCQALERVGDVVIGNAEMERFVTQGDKLPLLYVAEDDFGLIVAALDGESSSNSRS